MTSLQFLHLVLPWVLLASLQRPFERLVLEFPVAKFLWYKKPLMLCPGKQFLYTAFCLHIMGYTLLYCRKRPLGFRISWLNFSGVQRSKIKHQILAIATDFILIQHSVPLQYLIQKDTYNVYIRTVSSYVLFSFSTLNSFLVGMAHNRMCGACWSVQTT